MHLNFIWIYWRPKTGNNVGQKNDSSLSECQIPEEVSTAWENVHLSQHKFRLFSPWRVIFLDPNPTSVDLDPQGWAMRKIKLLGSAKRRPCSVLSWITVRNVFLQGEQLLPVPVLGRVLGQAWPGLGPFRRKAQAGRQALIGQSASQSGRSVD